MRATGWAWAGLSAVVAAAAVSCQAMTPAGAARLAPVAMVGAAAVAATPTDSGTPSDTGTPTDTATPSPTTTSPTPSPTTTSPTPSPTPSVDKPSAGCATVADGTGDVTPLYPSVPFNADDVDITGVTWRTSPSQLRIYLQVKTLAATNGPGGSQGGPLYGGDQFYVEQKIGDKVLTLTATRKTGDSPQVSDGLVAHLGTDDVSEALGASATPDTTNSQYVFAIPLSGLAEVLKAPVALGTDIAALKAKTFVVDVTGAPGSSPADSVDGGATATYTVGDSPCFGSYPTTIVDESDDTGAYGSRVEVVALLFAENGEPAVGRAVTFRLGKTAVTAITDDSGVADTHIKVTVPAGQATMTETFAGDSVADPASGDAPFDVSVSKTTTTVKVVRLRSGTCKLTATVMGAGKQPAAGLPLRWLRSGHTVKILMTNGRGQATYQTPTRSTYKAVFRAVAGKYRASAAQARC